MNRDAPVAQLDRASPSEGEGHTFEIVSGAPLRYRTGHAKTRRFCAFSGDERSQEHAFRPHDAQFFLVDFDALGERAEVIAAVAAAIGPHSLAGGPGKRLQRFWCDRRSAPFDRILGPLRVKAGLVARGLQFTDAVLQHGVREIGDTVLDGVVEPLEFGICLGRPLAQFGNVRPSSFGALGAAIE